MIFCARGVQSFEDRCSILCCVVDAGGERSAEVSCSRVDFVGWILVACRACVLKLRGGSLTSHMTTASTSNHASTSWRSLGPPSCLGGSSWVRSTQRVACGAGYATSETRPLVKHTAKPMRLSTVHQCGNVDDCRMHTCGQHGGVNLYSCDCDLGFQKTDIDGYEACENLDDCDACSIVQAMETGCV